MGANIIKDKRKPTFMAAEVKDKDYLRIYYEQLGDNAY